jgi:hypothetical protein
VTGSATADTRITSPADDDHSSRRCPMWLLIAGWISAVLVFSTFFMKTMIPLRLIGIARNVAFMSYALLGLQYGVFGQLYPILVLHAGLLPLNVIRLRQVRRLVDAVGAASDDEAIRALIPYMNTESGLGGAPSRLTRPGRRGCSAPTCGSGTPYPSRVPREGERREAGTRPPSAAPSLSAR